MRSYEPKIDPLSAIVLHLRNEGISLEEGSMVASGILLGIQLSLRHPEYAMAILPAEPLKHPMSKDIADDIVNSVPISVVHEGLKVRPSR